MRLTILALVILALTGCGGLHTGPVPISGHGGGSDGDTSALLLWISTGAIIGLGVCVAAAVLLPVKLLATSGAAGFGAVLVLALMLKASLPYLPWVALALGLIGLALGIWRFRQYVSGLNCAVKFGAAAANAETDTEIEALKNSHAAAQMRLGVKSIIDKAIAKI